MSTPSRRSCTATPPAGFRSEPPGLGRWLCTGHLPHLCSGWVWALRWILWLGLSLRMLVALGSLALGQADADQALRGFPKNSWYDPQSQQWLPPAVEPLEDEPLRLEGRVSPNPPASQNSASVSNSWWDWAAPGFNLSWLGPWLRVLAYAVLAILLAVCVAILVRFALRNHLPQSYSRRPAVTGISIDPARAVDLPFDVAAVGGDPLAEAERHMQAGNFDAAILSLYGYLLLVLDQSRLIHLQQGKTNRMYLRELRALPRLHDILEQSMLVFESCYFGKHSVSRQQFMAVWQTVDEFHRQLNALHAPQREGALSAEAVS